MEPYTPTLEHPAPANIGTSQVIYGSGSPTGTTALPGTVYVDKTGGTLYFTADGTTWTQISGGGGGGSVQLVAYTSGTPANPPDVTKNAWAYDPTGNLPALGWNTSNQTWN